VLIGVSKIILERRNIERIQMILPNNRYVFVDEYPVWMLPDYSWHKRLKIFINKGIQCETCGVVCDRLIAGRATDGAIHLDLYDSELKRMLTRGHIIPKALGGKKTLENLRPLCHQCNSDEGSSLETVCSIPELFSNHIRGKVVRRLSGNPFQDGRMTATILDVYKSPKTRKLFFFFLGGFTYPIDRVFFL